MQKKDIITYGIKDRVNYIQAKCAHLHLTQLQIKEILDADNECIEKIIFSGNDVLFGNLGKFKIGYVRPRDERVGINSFTGEPMIIPACEEHNKIKFNPSSSKKKELKEKYYGNAIVNKIPDEEEDDGTETYTS